MCKFVKSFRQYSVVFLEHSEFQTDCEYNFESKDIIPFIYLNDHKSRKFIKLSLNSHRTFELIQLKTRVKFQ